MFAAIPAQAQTIVTSAAPDDVDVTIYRAPNRSPATQIDLDWLEGYALISERRTVTIPAGESDIRFEGVAGGILPQSAIVTGLPDGIVERNRDAYLLSPATLLDRSLGRRVHLRRTSRATGAVREQDAIIRSGADGAVVLQTADGFEALRCTGLPETLAYESVPQGLSARPTLSVRTRAAQPVTATVTLSYLADGFDWQADYVAQLSSDGTRIELFAWLTLASMDETSFPNADTQAVAGRLNREEAERNPPEGAALQLRCWPQGTTSTVVAEPATMLRRARSSAVRGAPEFVGGGGEGEDSIVVTGTMIAQQEELGDLKLYRIPELVTVAANSQKQVAFLQQDDVRVAFVYRQRIDPEDDGNEAEPSLRYMVSRNERAQGLGIPLPAGRLRLFDESSGRPILIGEGTVRDRSVGEEVEVEVAEAPGVRTRVEMIREGKGRTDYRLVVSNDHATPVRFEGEFDVDEEYFAFRPRGRLSRRDGRPLWTVDVAANGTAELTYRLVDRVE